METNQQNQNELKQKPVFLNVTEVRKYNVSVYITEEHIVVQDFDDKKNGVVIPFELFKSRGHAKETAESGASESDSTESSPVAENTK